MKATNTPPTHVVLFVLFMVYISWGTVYLGNKLSLEVAGPFVVCGVRNILAGMLMLACARLSRGSWRRISPRDWPRVVCLFSARPWSPLWPRLSS